MMWHSQVQPTRPGIQNGPKFNPAETNNWEELLDSGYLDRQFGQGPEFIRFLIVVIDARKNKLLWVSLINIFSLV